MKLKNTIIYLIGYPGVGKLTTAKVLCRRLGARLLDNHTVNNPVFGVIGVDGISPIPKKAWVNIKIIRDILFDTILNIAPQHLNYVLTNVLLNEPEDKHLFQQVKKLAADRESLFVPVVLTCDDKELFRRVVMPDRAKNQKNISLKSARKRLREKSLIAIRHPNVLMLDNTLLTAEKSAEKILRHIIKLKSANKS